MDSSSHKKKKKKSTVKMIFIDWIVAAAVRFHYELKAQVRGPRGGQVRQSNSQPLNEPVLGGSNWELG